MVESLVSTHEYCRRARRVRAQHRDEVALKLASLRSLSLHRDRALQAGAQRSAAPDPLPDPVQEFSDRITCELTGTSILRYSRRVALLKRARRLGIDRLDANLLIAAAQDRTVVHASAPRWTAPIVAFALVQSAILLGAWTLLG